ncbi:MAG: N-acetylmuramoyl-L-alanine amidase [Geminicoccaceae bacterium]|nr:MAG: N-acetylmuramoyl-L-alanine amidase [Geminicoccaceae bacterium]
MRWWLVPLLLALLSPPLLAADLERVRIGVHEQSTRLVIETTRSLRAGIEQPAADRMELTVPARLAAAPNIAAPRGLIRSITAEPLGQGRTRLHLTFDRPTRVARAFALAPGDSGLHRFVIDVEPDATIRRAAATPPVEPPPVAAETAASAPPPAATVAPETRPRAKPPPRAPERPPAIAATSAPPTAAGETAASQPPVPANAPRRPVVVIDPGHGGVDPGAIGPSGVFEKDIVLAIGLALRDQLLADGRVEVVMTRETDRALTLARRLQIAAEARADLLLSLHADSLPNTPSFSGASVYTLSQQPSDSDAARKAREENAADERLEVITVQEDETVQAILTSIMRTSTTHRSVRAADKMAGELRRVTPMINRERRSANFVVLRSLHTPSVLVELGYLSNPADEARLQDPAHHQRLADALFRSVTAYFQLE